MSIERSLAISVLAIHVIYVTICDIFRRNVQILGLDL